MKTIKNTYDMDRVPLWQAVPLSTPFQLSVEPTFLCNLRCNYCLRSAPKEVLEKNGFSFSSMKWETFEKILSQTAEFHEKIKKITFSGFGEPLLSPELPDMIKLLKEKDVARKLGVITNGLLLTEKLWANLRDAGLTEIKFSIQGLTSKKYKDICGADIDLKQFYQTLTHVYKNKGECKIKIKVADSALEQGDEEEFYEKFGGICDFISVEHVYPQFSHVDYKGKLVEEKGLNRYGYEFKRRDVCSPLFFKLNVLQNGKITFGYPDGVSCDEFNVNQTTLKAVWDSPERHKFLIDHLLGNYEGREECKVCTRWSYSTVPEDILDGHENKILARMKSFEDVAKNAGTLCKLAVACGNFNPNI